MKPILQFLVISISLTLASLGLSACGEEGPAERAGRALDEAVEDVAEAGRELAEDAEQAVEDAAEAVGDAVDEAEDSVQDAKGKLEQASESS